MLHVIDFNDEKDRSHKHIREEHYDNENRRIVKTVNTDDCPTCSKEK